MPDQEVPSPEKIEVDVPVIKKGNVRFLTKAARDNPAPRWFKNFIRIIQGIIIGLLPFIGGTDYFSGGQVKAISFWMGVTGIICETILKMTGVESTADTQKRLDEE